MTEGSGLSLTRRGERVALRPLSEGDLPAVESWYGENAASGPTGSLFAIIQSDDGAPAGVLGYWLGVPEEGWLTFDSVSVEPGLRGLGLDSEAVLLVEGDAVRRGLAHRFWAGVRRDNGLGLYFWLRLGYRPARPAEGPWPGGAPRDMMAMIRMSENPWPGPEVGL